MILESFNNFIANQKSGSIFIIILPFRGFFWYDDRCAIGRLRTIL